MVYQSHGEPRIISTERQPRNSRLVATNEYEPRLIEQRYVGERITNITTNALEQRVISGKKPEMRRSVKAIETYEDDPIIQERIIEKEIEVIVE